MTEDDLYEKSNVKNYLKESVRIYGAWDASENSPYGFTYRMAIFEITELNFCIQNSHPPSNHYNLCSFDECVPYSNNSNDMEYFLCLEMKNIKCNTLRSSPFEINLNKNGMCNLQTNIVVCAKYPHFNHLKANYMTLSIQKRSRAKPKLLTFHQIVAHVYINMEYVLQNNRITSVTLDCTKSKLFDVCEIFFKNISTNVLPTIHNNTKYKKHRWQLKGIPNKQITFTRLFSPRLKRKFPYLKNQQVFNVMSLSDDESTDSMNEELSSDSELSISSHQSSIEIIKYDGDDINQLTPHTVGELMKNQMDDTLCGVSFSDNTLSVESNTPSDDDDFKCKRNIIASLVDSTLYNTSKYDDSIIKEFSKISVSNKPSMLPESNHELSFNDTNNTHKQIEECYTSNDSEIDSYVVPANILVFISGGQSNISKKLYKLYNNSDHPNINCVYLKNCTWIRQFIEEWNHDTNFDDRPPEYSFQSKCRIFLFGNDRIMKTFINELSKCKSLSTKSTITNELLEFLFIPTDFPCFYADYISNFSSLYKSQFTGEFWRDFILDDALTKDRKKAFDHFIEYITLENYETQHFQIGKAIINTDTTTETGLPPLFVKDPSKNGNIVAFISCVQLINDDITVNNNKFVIEYTLKNDTINCKRIKLKKFTKIVLTPKRTYIEFTIYGVPSSRYSLTKIISKSNNKRILLVENVTIYYSDKFKNLQFDVYIDGNPYKNLNSLQLFYNWNNSTKILPICLPMLKQ